MNTIIHKAEQRGQAEHGWLHARHSFSFAEYYDAERMGFGKLRVINDDIIDPGAGFDTHGHDNMEIVTVPLSGTLQHQDSMGHTQVIQPGEVQHMSAGSGIRHSEYNHSQSEPLNLLQIWVLPKERDITPSYTQKEFDASERQNQWQLLVSPGAEDGAIGINQEAWFLRGDFAAGQQGHYRLHQPEHGVYLFVIDGAVDVADTALSRRDAVGLTGFTEFELTAQQDSQLLLIEVPM